MTRRRGRRQTCSCGSCPKCQNRLATRRWRGREAADQRTEAALAFCLDNFGPRGYPADSVQMMQALTWPYYFVSEE